MKNWVKKTYHKLKDKLIELLKWIWMECKDWHTIVLLLIVMAVLHIPIWGGYILSWVFGWDWAAWVATVMIAFWLGPFSPFIPLAVGITLAIKRLFDKKEKFSNVHPDENEGAESADEPGDESADLPQDKNDEDQTE